MGFEGIAQVVVSGLLIGLVYALIAAGLSLIFGLMDVVNFAHGEFLMTAMYATFALALVSALDPVLLLPAVAGLLFCLGFVVYKLLITAAMKARTNVGMAQIFATFGLGIFMRGVAQLVFTADFMSIKKGWLADSTISILGVFLPTAQLASAVVCLLAFLGLYLMTAKTDFGRALEATREDSEAVALIGVDRHKIFAMGWGIGAATVGVAGAMLATFYYIYPNVGASFALIAYITVALGGFGSMTGALVAGITIGIVEAVSAVVISPSLKDISVYALYLVVVLVRPRGLFGHF